MSSQPQSPFVSREEYLAIERASETKSEYYQGEIFAMGGASRRHNLVVANILVALHDQLQRRNCEAYASDMRVKVDATGLYTYPDIVVVCDQPKFEDNAFDTLLNPNLLIEVLSPTTEAYDRGQKFEHYRKLPTLVLYLLVAYDRCQLERFTRQSDGLWAFSEASDPNGMIGLDAIGGGLQLSDIYARLD